MIDTNRTDEIRSRLHSGFYWNHRTSASADIAWLLAENDRLRANMKERFYATVYERTAWHHDIGEHEGSEFPYAYCPRCEMEHPKGRFAELRAVAAQLAEALEYAYDEVHPTWMDSRARAALGAYRQTQQEQM